MAVLNDFLVRSSWLQQISGVDSLCLVQSPTILIRMERVSALMLADNHDDREMCIVL